MNVIVANEQQNQLSNLDVDVIKNITGQYDVLEVVEMFKNFFYNKMILDVTALNDYSDFKTYEKLIHGLEADKIIFLLPEGTNLCTSNFLGQLISIGIYNFTTNLNGIVYLLKKPNTFKDVEHILKMANIQSSGETGAINTSLGGSSNGRTILGIKNVSDSAGASTFTYMLLKELSLTFGKDNVCAIEINKNDFILFNDKSMVSIKENEIKNVLDKYSKASIILVDLNDSKDISFCNDIIYLIEPSTIKLNKLVKKNKDIFSELSNKKIVLNQSLLLNNDIHDFENEVGIKVFYNMPPLDERKNNAIIGDFLTKLGIKNNNGKSTSTKIFGLFRR